MEMFHRLFIKMYFVSGEAFFRSRISPYSIGNFVGPMSMKGTAERRSSNIYVVIKQLSRSKLFKWIGAGRKYPPTLHLHTFQMIPVCVLRRLFCQFSSSVISFMLISLKHLRTLDLHCIFLGAERLRSEPERVAEDLYSVQVYSNEYYFL